MIWLLNMFAGFLLTMSFSWGERGGSFRVADRCSERVALAALGAGSSQSRQLH